MYLLSCVAFAFTDVLSLLTLDIYITSELIHCLRVCRLPEMNPGNPGVSLLSQVPESERKKRGRNWNFIWDEGSKNGVEKCEEDEIKGSKSGAGSSDIYWC